MSGLHRHCCSARLRTKGQCQYYRSSWIFVSILALLVNAVFIALRPQCFHSWTGGLLFFVNTPKLYLLAGNAHHIAIAHINIVYILIYQKCWKESKFSSRPNDVIGNSRSVPGGPLFVGGGFALLTVEAATKLQRAVMTNNASFI